MDRKKLEILQKGRKRYLDTNNDSDSEALSDQRDPNDNNNDQADDLEEERPIIKFELGTTQKGGVCLWFEG